MGPTEHRAADGPPATDGGETPKARLNRELDQLLQELRVALPGVQVLLAFLLTVPFSQRFGEIDLDAQRAYGGAVLLTAVASVLLIAPTVHHRLRFRDGVKEELIHLANRLALSGAASLGLAIGCALYVVGDVAFPATPLRLMGPALVLLTIVVWFVLPLRFRSSEADRI